MHLAGPHFTLLVVASSAEDLEGVPAALEAAAPLQLEGLTCAVLALDHCGLGGESSGIPGTVEAYRVPDAPAFLKTFGIKR